MRTSPLRILYLSPCWPHGPAFGGQLRALHTGRALKKVGDVTLAVVSSDAPDPEAARKSAAEFKIAPAIHVKTVRNRRLTQRVRWALDTQYLNVHGCVADEPDRSRLLGQLETFDLVWVLNSRTPNILNHWQWPHSVLDLDDVPSTFQRTILQNGAGPKTKFKAAVQMFLLKRREFRWRERFTALSVCSELDRQYLGGGDRIHVIPNGFEQPASEPVRKLAAPPRIGFIGLFSYEPNLEGVRWFVRDCWPRIKQQVPDARLRLVGRETDGPLKPAAPDVDALGWVADSAAEIATWSAMIVPVHTGGGTRIKIAEAFSRKCPLVSTTTGAYGYEVEDRKELLLADRPSDFADACVTLIKEPAKGTAMAERAWQKFLNNWTWEAIAPRVVATAEDALRRSRTGGRI